MADERDPQISRRYRELGTEQPSPELDRAILGAARRATRRNRWYPSLAAAAVLVFAVAIVVQIERQPPAQEPMSAPPAQEAPAPRRPAPPSPPAPAPDANATAAVAGALGEAERKRADETRAAPQLQRSMGARAGAAANLHTDVAESPEQWLVRIARLRELGRDEEADRELARFRERYPDYRIPEAMAKKVEKQAPAAAPDK